MLVYISLVKHCIFMFLARYWMLLDKFDLIIFQKLELSTYLDECSPWWAVNCLIITEAGEGNVLLSSWPVWQNTAEGHPSSYVDSMSQTRLCKTAIKTSIIPHPLVSTTSGFKGQFYNVKPCFFRLSNNEAIIDPAFIAIIGVSCLYFTWWSRSDIWVMVWSTENKPPALRSVPYRLS